jgi:hypothetical protein
MTDHAAEQEMEMEALHAILMDDIEEYDGSHPAGWEAAAVGRPSWRVAIHPPDDAGDGGGDGDDGAATALDASDELKLDLVFAHVALYPDEPPLFRLRSVKGLSDADIEDATRAVREQVDACAGAAMVYNMVTAAQEWLGARIAAARNGGGAGGDDDPVAARKRAEAEEEARRLAARAHGTPVTRESFAAWQKSFEAEMAKKRAAAAGAGQGADGAGGGKGGQQQQQQQDKLTGKQWFLQAAAAAKDGEAVDDGSPELADDEECDDYVRTDHGEEDGGDRGDEDEDDDDFDPDDDDDDEDDDELLEFAIKRVAG